MFWSPLGYSIEPRLLGSQWVENAHRRWTPEQSKEVDPCAEGTGLPSPVRETQQSRDWRSGQLLHPGLRQAGWGQGTHLTPGLGLSVHVDRGSARCKDTQSPGT